MIGNGAEVGQGLRVGERSALDDDQLGVVGLDDRWARPIVAICVPACESHGSSTGLSLDCHYPTHILVVQHPASTRNVLTSDQILMQSDSGCCRMLQTLSRESRAGQGLTRGYRRG